MYGLLTARYATLVNVHRLDPERIYNLTPRQIETLYFHPRDEHGAIKPPAGAPGPPLTPQAKLAKALALVPKLKRNPALIAKLAEKLGVQLGDTARPAGSTSPPRGATTRHPG